MQGQRTADTQTLMIGELLNSGPNSTGLDRYLPMLTEDARIELRWAPTGFPNDMRGHEELRHAFALLDDYDWRITAVAGAEPLLDSNTWQLFVEAEVIVKSTGTRYRNSYLLTMRLRDGKIAHCIITRDPLAPQTEIGVRGNDVPRRGGQVPIGTLRTDRTGPQPITTDEVDLPTEGVIGLPLW
ncbi:nuclear transport factor 2 family protein [Nocardia transvalensis]|uniref:nuclear transport factor 2 family protein n=1 Tax=Nocardia transvalensis TaxID=37333 RepID=UPI001895AA96|nr:nuclear transport factor 2 family protein [Nocardia transvalensis]MBF6327682.1 nuclear transport factor 2 family protein [Nocardia transvalensis]